MWRGRGTPHTATGLGCPLCPIRQCVCPLRVPLCWAGVQLMLPPLPGSEGNPVPAAQSPAVGRTEDAAPAVHPGHPLRTEVSGPPAAGASGLDPAASGGRTHLGQRLRRGRERPVTWLFSGNVQVPCENTHDPPTCLGAKPVSLKRQPWPTPGGRGCKAGGSTGPAAPHEASPLGDPELQGHSWSSSLSLPAAA